MHEIGCILHSDFFPQPHLAIAGAYLASNTLKNSQKFSARFARDCFFNVSYMYLTQAQCILHRHYATNVTLHVFIVFTRSQQVQRSFTWRRFFSVVLEGVQRCPFFLFYLSILAQSLHFFHCK